LEKKLIGWSRDKTEEEPSDDVTEALQATKIFILIQPIPGDMRLGISFGIRN
jgi:hypothetical protein